jgi:hypothetical protein
VREDIFFKGDSHKARLLAAMQQLNQRDGDRYDSEYGAALYVLTSDHWTWEKAQEYVGASGRPGIKFEELLAEADWSEGYLILVKWAANLFNEFAAHIDPVQLMRLDEGNFAVALTALVIRRNGLRMSDLEH